MEASPPSPARIFCFLESQPIPSLGRRSKSLVQDRQQCRLGGVAAINLHSAPVPEPSTYRTSAMFVAPPAATECTGMGAIIPAAQFFPRPGHIQSFRQSAEQVFGGKLNLLPTPTEMQVPEPTTHRTRPGGLAAFVRHFRCVGSVFEAACPTCTIVEVSTPPRQTHSSLQRTSTEDSSASTASDVLRNDRMISRRLRASFQARGSRCLCHHSVRGS
jgi:hypothetical protein